ncbi:MAG: SpoIIE family protein phosphatase [Candidatus Omnitrophica bacterium]|nr:SpoIIE family protein phosphatase [Candidatus Omnitrophota bacterium]
MPSERYKVLEEFISDPLSVVYKARDLEQGGPVLLSVLSEKARNRPIDILMRFKRSVEQFSKLAHPNLLKILSVLDSDDEFSLVYGYFDSESLSKHLNKPWDINKAVDLIIQVSSALDEAHQQGLLHQAVSPGSILLGREQPQAVRLYNFGFSILRDISKITRKEDVVSTFGYLSPESSGILRKPVDYRSDIYSLGIVFYQLLTGRLPYLADDMSSLVHQHIATKPAAPSVLNRQIPPVLDNIILRLMAKEPQERYQGLKGLISDLREYQKQSAQGKPLIDFEIARSDRLAQLSFSSKMIGRESELGRMRDLLGQAKRGNGSLCFVCGEPGIGKSRLIDELRGYVYGLGGLFAGGKCYQYELRVPYRVWSEAIDAYIEKIKRLSQAEQDVHIGRIRDSLGELGSEVVKIAPALADLVGVQPKPAELEPEKERVRFLITVANFVASLASRENPLLLFLDHMHWMDDVSAEILFRVAEKISGLPILLVVCYRDAEVGHNHPLDQLIKTLDSRDIPYSKISLKSLTVKETSEMVSQILMEKEEQVMPLAQFLNQRAKGNPFFTIELLHSLAETGLIYLQEGQYIFNLSRIKEVALPEDIVDIILKRTKDLSLEQQQFLSYAAVMGREVQFDLLSRVTGQPSDFIVNTIEKSIEKQFLFRDIVGKEKVFFMHSRIREAFYNRISYEARVPLHRQIGMVLEEQNKANPDVILYDLVHHFTQGYVHEKVLHYSVIAAAKAKSSYANTMAVNLFELARDILERENRKNSPKYMEIIENLGEVYRLAGRLDESIATFKTLQYYIPKQDMISQARVLSKIGDAFFDKGEVKESIYALEKALLALNVRIPKTRPGYLLEILKEILVQALHTWFPGVFIGKGQVSSPSRTIILKTFLRLVHIYYFSDINKVFYFYLKTLNMAQETGPGPELAYCYIEGAAVWPTLPWFSRAFSDGNKGLKMAQEMGDKMREGSANVYLSLYSYVVNDPRASLDYSRKAINLLKGLGEYWDLSMAYTFRNYSSWITGRLKENIAEGEEFIALAKEANALRGLGWAIFGRCKTLCLIGEVDDATIKTVNEFNILIQRTQDKPNVLWSLCILSFAYLRRGEYEQAIQVIKEASDLFALQYNKTPWLLDFFPLGAQIYLDVLADAPGLSKETKAAYMEKAEWLCRLSYKWSRKYQYCLGWAYQVNGTCLWLAGKKEDAVYAWDEGIKFLREKTGDKYRLAYLLLEESRFSLMDDPRDKKALTNLLEAKELFISMGCKQDLQTCNELLFKLIPQGEGVESRDALTQRRHLESLLSVTRAIGSVFALDELLRRVLDYALKATGAERGLLLLYDDKTNQLNLKLSHGVEISDFFSFESYKISLELIREAEKAKDAILASPESAVSAKVQNELKSYNVKQALAAYLSSRDKPIGILYLDNSLSGGTFGKQELELMQSFAVQASVSLENANLISDLLDQARLKQELELGREIQMDLLPKVTPVIPGLKVSGLMLPAKEIGGDYYDFLPNPQTNSLSIVIGDVSGKGVAAGLLMAMVKTCLYALNKQPISPREILLATNQMLYEHINAKKFMTMLYLTWDASRKKFIYSSAGHEHIITYRGGIAEAVLSGGFMLGMLPEISSFLEDKELVLNPGDKIVLYTDGVTEARDPNEKLFRLERLVELVRKHGAKPADQLLSVIKEEVYSFIGTREQFDDITLVVMEAA